MRLLKIAAILVATVCLSTQGQSNPRGSRESTKAVKKWSKPGHVFGSYRPGKVSYHNRYRRSESLSSRGGSPRARFQNLKGKKFYRHRSINVVATAYTNSPRENGGYTTTATGTGIYRGGVAVDPRVIPLGTYLYIENYGFGFACDTGGAIKGKRIDIVMPNDRASRKWGRRKVKVWILKPYESKTK